MQERRGGPGRLLGGDCPGTALARAVEQGVRLEVSDVRMVHRRALQHYLQLPGPPGKGWKAEQGRLYLHQRGWQRAADYLRAIAEPGGKDRQRLEVTGREK